MKSSDGRIAIEQLNLMGVNQLKRLAGIMHIKGYRKLKKADLVHAIYTRSIAIAEEQQLELFKDC